MSKVQLLDAKCAQMLCDTGIIEAESLALEKLDAIATEKTKVVPVRSEDEWMDQFDLLHPASVRYRCTWANGEKGYEPGYFDQWHGYLGALRLLGLVAATRDA